LTKIKLVEAIPLSIPLTETEPSQLWLEEWSVQLLVRIKTYDGLVGYGQTLVAGSGIVYAYKAVIDQLLSKLVIDRTPYELNELTDIMEKAVYSAGRGGITSGAISGVEIALWDLIAKLEGKPLNRLLGSSKMTIPVYASISRYRKPEEVVNVCEKILKEGYNAVKLHQPVVNILETVKMLREKLGYGFHLMVDLNCGFTSLFKAIEHINRLQRFELRWIEEPLWPPEDYDKLAKLVAKSPISVAMGENEYTLYGFRKLLEIGVEILQPDVTKDGGIRNTLRIADLAESYGAKIALHCRPDNGWVGIAASAHLLSSIKNWLELETPPNNPPSDVYKIAPKIRKGILTIPETEGLGIEFQPDALTKYSYKEKLRLLKFADLEENV